MMNEDIEEEILRPEPFPQGAALVLAQYVLEQELRKRKAEDQDGSGDSSVHLQ
jgi:hypothetical protein